MIRIGVDGRLLQGKLTGVGKYILGLIEFIAGNINDCEIRIYTNREIGCAFNSSKIALIRDRKRFSMLKSMIWSKFFSHRITNLDNPDIYLSGDTFIPLFLRVKKILSVVHDVAYIVTPETMSTLHLLISKVFFKSDLLKANALIANSKGTADKIEKYFKSETDVIVYPIIDNTFLKLDEEVVRAELAKHNINYPYILSVGTQEPRKNLDKTIKAFLYLKRKGELHNYKLLLIGGSGWKSKKIRKLVSAYSNDIISLGYVEDSLLPYLYNGATLFVFPSKYEGFGMPPREAMLCGSKVLVTDIPELKEATYEKGNYVNNLEEGSFGNAIIHSLNGGHVYSREELDFSYSQDQKYKLISLIHQLVH